MVADRVGDADACLQDAGAAGGNREGVWQGLRVALAVGDLDRVGAGGQRIGWQRGRHVHRPVRVLAAAGADPQARRREIQR